MLETVVKFVDDGDFFMTSEGPNVRLFTVNPIPATGSITVKSKSEFDSGDYLILPTPEIKYYVWFDKNGDGVTDDPSPVGFETDAAVVVDVSSITTAEQIASALATALDDLENINAVVNTENDVQFILTTAGECDPISDPTCGFALTNVLGGINAGGVVKTGFPSMSNRIEEVRDLDYDSSTDTLIVLAKVKTKTNINIKDNPGYIKTSEWRVIKDTPWVFG